MKRITRMKSLWAGASLALCLGAASALAGTVTVTLIDSQGNPLSGGQVSTYYEGSKGSTDGSGTLTFSETRTTDTVSLKYN